MKLTTLRLLEAQAAELKKSKLLDTKQRDEALLTNARSRAIIESLNVGSLEEAEDVIRDLQHRAQQTEAMEREIARIKLEIEATKKEQSK